LQNHSTSRRALFGTIYQCPWVRTSFAASASSQDQRSATALTFFLSNTLSLHRRIVDVLLRWTFRLSRNPLRNETNKRWTQSYELGNRLGDCSVTSLFCAHTSVQLHCRHSSWSPRSMFFWQSWGTCGWALVLRNRYGIKGHHAARVCMLDTDWFRCV